MNSSKFHSRFIIVLAITLFFSTVSIAQNGRHYERHENRSYGYHNTYRYPQVSIAIPYPRYTNYYYRPHAYYPHVYSTPYHYDHFGPAFGLRIGILPFGFSTIYIGRSPYYYHEGVYYRPYPNGGYEVTVPPLGAEVSRLPAGARVTVIDGEKYYEIGGTFYQEIITSGNRTSYKVVGTDGVLNTGNAYDQQIPAINNNSLPSIGSKVDQLPEGSKVVVINQQKYFLSADGVYYQEVIEGNSIKYEVTGTQSN